MARDASKNLQLSVSVEYNVYNWKLWEQQVQENIDSALERYGQMVREEAQNLIAPPDASGPGPHPHRTTDLNDSTKPYNWRWEDTGALADALEWEIKGRGFLRTVEIFVNPIQDPVDGELVDYGTFLEVGWHPMIPGKDGQVRPSGRFFAYPWLSTSIAKANIAILRGIAKELRPDEKSFPQIQLFGRKRAEDGYGWRVQQNKFAVSENITSAVFQTRTSGGSIVKDTLSGWLIPKVGEAGWRRVPGVRTTKHQNRVLNARDARNYARRSASYRNNNPPPKKRPT